MSRVSQIDSLCKLLYAHNVPSYVILAEKLYDEGVRVVPVKYRIEEIRTNRRGKSTVNRLGSRFDSPEEARKYIGVLESIHGKDERVQYVVLREDS